MTASTLHNGITDDAVRPVYPAECHFRIVTGGAPETLQALREATAACQVTAPLTLSRRSSGSRYCAYSLSLLIRSRAELDLIDAALKQTPGVRMVL